jgi:O-acetyl-ADP-ribose deacetylase (regulator of RNase III)
VVSARAHLGDEGVAFFRRIKQHGEVIVNACVGSGFVAHFVGEGVAIAALRDLGKDLRKKKKRVGPFGRGRIDDHQVGDVLRMTRGIGHG